MIAPQGVVHELVPAHKITCKIESKSLETK